MKYHPGQACALEYYGCVICQTQHFEYEALYDDHLTWQSKHGIQQMPFANHEALIVFQSRRNKSK